MAARRFPFGHEPTPPRAAAESEPRDRATEPLAGFVPPARVLPFRPPPMPVITEMQPPEAPPIPAGPRLPRPARSRLHIWALLLLSAAVLIVSYAAWSRRAVRREATPPVASAAPIETAAPAPSAREIASVNAVTSAAGTARAPVATAPRATTARPTPPRRAPRSSDVVNPWGP